MKKLDFRVGKWSRQASVARGLGVVVECEQSEAAQFKLDGFLDGLLVIGGEELVEMSSRLTARLR
jgi:hypothetical protein